MTWHPDGSWSPSPDDPIVEGLIVRTPPGRWPDCCGRGKFCDCPEVGDTTP